MLNPYFYYMKLRLSFFILVGTALLVSCSSPEPVFVKKTNSAMQEKIVKTCPDGRPYYDLYGEESLGVPELLLPIESTPEGLHYTADDLDFWVPLSYDAYNVFVEDEGLLLSQAEDAHCMVYGDLFEPYITRIDPADSFANGDWFSEVKTETFPHFDARIYTELSFGGNRLDTYEFKLGDYYYRSGAMADSSDMLKAVLSTLKSSE
jgi:hypothetical protein